MVLRFQYILWIALGLACQPPDCDRQDCGTCGNACCNMLYYFDISVDKIFADMQSLFSKGIHGPDGRYSLQPMAEGSEGFADVRDYNLTISYIAQLWHTTQTQHYNDTIDMTFAADVKGGSTLKIFSISQIGGAWCDYGQNYKNVIQLVKALEHDYEETNVLGCTVEPQ